MKNLVLMSVWVGMALTALGSVSEGASADILQDIYNGVDANRLSVDLKSMTGGLPVTVGGESFLITDRYLPASKEKFRKFFIAYFQSLNIPVQEMSYPTRHHIGESQGHNVEAVLQGHSPDSIVIIVHYDSIGPAGDEAGNPGVDDDMTGMSVSLETARILAQLRDHLHYTVRFVAADYEEHAMPGLEGARSYAAYIRDLAKKENFVIRAAVDNEQSGWNCARDGLCRDASQANIFDVFDCSGGMLGHRYNYKDLGDRLQQIATTYGGFQVSRGCMGANSDHYAMWEIGVPAVVYSEHKPFNNPHFDAEGGDTYDKIDFDYFSHIARVGVTFAASLVGFDN